MLFYQWKSVAILILKNCVKSNDSKNFQMNISFSNLYKMK